MLEATAQVCIVITALIDLAMLVLLLRQQSTTSAGFIQGAGRPAGRRCAPATPCRGVQTSVQTTSDIDTGD
jgi:hypothetical protein